MIYLAGPYTSTSKDQHEFNIGKLYSYYSYLHMRYNEAIICPPLSSLGFDYSSLPEITTFNYLKSCFEIIKKSDLIYFTPDWRESSGCRQEYQVALSSNVPIIYLEKLPSSEIENLKAHFLSISKYNLNALYGFQYLSLL